VDEHPETLIGIAGQELLHGGRLGSRHAGQEDCRKNSSYQRLARVHAVFLLDAW
jgi:hypothetical protein